MSKKVKFLQDFQGKETREQFYKKDAVVEIADELLDRLITDGRVELVTFDLAMASEPQFENVYYGAQAEPEIRNDEVLHDVMTAPKKKGGRK